MVMTKLNWKKIISHRNFWTASGVSGSSYTTDGPVRDFTRGDPDGVVHYPVHYLSSVGRSLEPPAATLAEAKALAQVDNIRLHRARRKEQSVPRYADFLSTSESRNCPPPAKALKTRENEMRMVGAQGFEPWTR